MALLGANILEGHKVSRGLGQSLIQTDGSCSIAAGQHTQRLLLGYLSQLHSQRMACSIRPLPHRSRRLGVRVAPDKMIDLDLVGVEPIARHHLSDSLPHVVQPRAEGGLDGSAH